MDWLTQGSWTSLARRISLAADGDLGVFGVTDFKGSLQLGGTQITTSNNLNGVLFRLGSSGLVEWVRPLQPWPEEFLSPWTQVTGVVVDPSGTAFIVGRFNGQLPVGTNVLQSMGYWSAFVARFDRQGNCRGVRQISGWEAVSPWAVAADSHGHVLIAGDIGTAWDEPGSTVMFGESVLLGRGFVDAFVAKMESSLPIVHASEMGTDLLISWSWIGPELVLESSDAVAGSTWIVRTETVSRESRRHSVRLPIENKPQFFRLRARVGD